MKLHECRTEGLRAIWQLKSIIRHFWSAVRHFWSAKWHLAMLQCSHHAGPTPHFSNARFAFLHFLKKFYFVGDHETLS